MALCPGGKLRTFGDVNGVFIGYSFHCPGCGENHGVPTTGKKAWRFNGNEESPTFQPSLLVTSGHFTDRFKPGDECWCTYHKTNPDCGYRCYRCHSFITDGRIQFLGDCTHALAGQTVDIPQWEEDK